MISVSCVELKENGGPKNICEIYVKSYDQLIFKTIRGVNEEDDKFLVMLPDFKWYAVPEEEFLTHLEESEIEDVALGNELSCELDIDLDEEEED